MPVQMTGNTRTRDSTEIHSQVEAIGLERLFQDGQTPGQKFSEQSTFLTGKKLGRRAMAARGNEQVTAVVGKAVEHHERSRAAV